MEVGGSIGFDRAGRVRPQLRSGDGSSTPRSRSDGGCRRNTETDPAFVYHREERAAGYGAVHSTPSARSGNALGCSRSISPLPRVLTPGFPLVAFRPTGGGIRRECTAVPRLREADRSKNEFLATLAHELRNPLAPIRNAVQILHLKAVPSPEVQWALEVVDRQMEHMTRLVDDLLDIARITGNNLELRREPVELADVLRVAAETSRPLIEASGQEFVVNLPEETLFLDGDLTRLSQVVSNLLNNSAKYTERGGRIELGARREGSDAVITVRTPLGIPGPGCRDLRDLHPGPVTRHPMGLGANSRGQGLVAMHNGTIEARLGDRAGERVHQTVSRW